MNDPYMQGEKSLYMGHFIYIYNVLHFNILHLIYPVLCYHNQAALTVHLFISLHGDMCDFFRKIKEKQDCS